MSTTGIFELVAGTVLASGDVIPFVDISDTTQAPQGSLLKITVANFFGAVPVAAVFSSTLGVTGNFAVATNKFTVAALSGNTVVAGTLAVTGASTLTGATNVVGDFSVATNKLTVASASGNTVVAGTLGVTGATTLTGAVTHSSTTNAVGDFTVNTNKFTVTASSGNTVVAGTLGVTGATTLTGAATLSSTANVVGDFSVATNKFTVTASSGNTSVAGTFAVTGASTLTGATNVVADFSVATNKFTVASSTGNTAVAGTFAVAGIGQFASDFGPTSTASGTLASTTITFDFSDSNSMYYTTSLAADRSVTMTNLLDGHIYRGMIVDPNGKIVTFNTYGGVAVKWLGSAFPSTALTALKAVVFVIWCLGQTPYGQWSQEA